MSGCHSAGGQVPDLTPPNAYRSIFEEDLVDINDPRGKRDHGLANRQIKPAMPLGAQTNPSNINNLMLAWIKQGPKQLKKSSLKKIINNLLLKKYTVRRTAANLLALCLLVNVT